MWEVLGACLESHLGGVVVKASSLSAGDPKISPRSTHTDDLLASTLVVTQPCIWHSGVSTRTNWTSGVEVVLQEVLGSSLETQ